MDTLLVANWKMNLSRTEGTVLAKKLAAFVKKLNLVGTEVSISLAPTAAMLGELAEIVSESGITLSAQDCSTQSMGAYTGEVSARTLKEYGCDHVIVGHSERRKYYSEDSDVVSKKADLAYEHKLTPIICVGETFYEREQGVMRDVLAKQLLLSLPFQRDDVKQIIVTYEPVWAVGSGKVPTAKQIEEATDIIEQAVELKFASQKKNLTILYGGSVNAENCKSILQIPKVRGLLIGGASLIYDVFIQIIEHAFKANKVLA